LSYDAVLTAQNVARSWPALAGTLPKALADAIAVLDAAKYVEAPWTGIEVEKLDPKNVGQSITDLAVTLASASQFDEAKRAVHRALASQVLHAAGAAVPEVIEKIKPSFDKAVIEFTEAVKALPDQITSSTLVDAGPAVLDAYQRGTAAAGVIGAVDSWLANLADLPAHAGFDRDRVLRVLAPSTPHQLQMLVIETGGNKDPHLQRLGALYVDAVRYGIQFAMHTPREAAQLRNDLEEAARAARAKKAFA
jgi:hypothetical protein